MGSPSRYAHAHGHSLGRWNGGVTVEGTGLSVGKLRLVIAGAIRSSKSFRLVQPLNDYAISS